MLRRYGAAFVLVDASLVLPCARDVFRRILADETAFLGRAEYDAVNGNAFGDD